MRLKVTIPVLVIGIVAAQAFAASDRQKTEKQINRISAMAADLTGRRAVNLSMSQQLSVSRQDLVAQRRANNITYGTLFLLRQVTSSDEAFNQAVAQIKTGKQPFDVAEASHVDWKAVGNAAKKLNSKIEDNLYKYFVNNDSEVSAGDKTSVGAYDPAFDSVMADSEVSKQDLAEAQDTYLFWRGRATGKKDATLEHNKEQAARQTVDPVRKGGPQADQVGNTGAPPR
ncbi:MAG TPA: hypothetical protein VFP40_03670 [Terriglobales bacterium]|nr:hypothetical protein [Terriglobales bacterium]